MGGNWFLQLCHSYALVMGVTTHRRLEGSYSKSWIRSIYALVVNVLTVGFFPWACWRTTQFVKTSARYPRLLFFTTYTLFGVSYVTILYTLASRFSRDKVLLEVEHIVQKFKRHQTENSSEAAPIDDNLKYLYHFKMSCVVFLGLTGLTGCLVIPNEQSWSIMLFAFFYSNAMNIPLLAIYRYFLAMWDIASSYRSLGIQVTYLLDRVLRNPHHQPSNGQLDELRRIWLLHSLLGRCTRRLHRIYQLLILAARLDYMVFIAINGYWGVIFSVSPLGALHAIIFGITNYLVHLLDLYLLNLMCDLAIQYQSSAIHDLMEVSWFKELNAFVLYAKASKLNLSVCGLYEVNRRSWFKMQVSILNFSILLLQYHLLLNKNYKLY